KLDILINNAGDSSPWVLLTETEPSSWWNTMEVNLKGPYLLLHAFLPLLVETAEANKTTVDVLNVSSIGAHTTSPGASAYQISKLAVLRLTEFVDAEFGQQGVNAIALHPGGVKTELARKRTPFLSHLLNDTSDLCGGFVVWLTKGARTWLAGRYVSATWDVEKLESMREEIVAGDKLKVRLVV
ncbi:NAD(P)-binding protein, partial [Lindgomyces ingoldianus]